MGARKILPVMGLLLMAGAAVLLLKPPAPSAPEVLPPAPAWQPFLEIAEKFASSDPLHRIEAARLANDYGDPALEPLLLQALKAADTHLADARLAASARESNRRIRITVIAALCRLEGPTGEAHIAAFIGDAEPLVRRAAIMAAGRRGFTPAPEAIIPLLSDPHAEVRMEAAVAVGILKPAGITDALHAAATEGPAAPRMLLAAAQLGGPGALAVVEAGLRDEARTIPAGEAAVALGEAAIPLLTRTLSDSREPARRVAADADFAQQKLMPVRLPYWARVWWQRNGGKPPAQWTPPPVPKVPTL